LAKADETDKKRMAINAAHTKRGTPSIGLAQQCCLQSGLGIQPHDEKD